MIDFQELNIEKKTIHISIEQYKQEVLKLYNEGKTIREIGKLLDRHHVSISRVLHEFGISLIHLKGGTRQKKLVNIEKFNSNTEFSNYIIGYIAADGNIADDSIRKNKDGTVTIKAINTISIISKDKDMIDKFSIYLENASTYNKGNIYRLYFASKEIKNYLIELGITPNKSRTFQYNGKINVPFIRGLFDGDGSLSNSRPKITSGSSNFIDQLSEFFKSLNYQFSIYKKGNAFDFTFTGESKKYFVNAIYKDATIYLERKYQQAIKYGLLDSNI